MLHRSYANLPEGGMDMYVKETRERSNTITTFICFYQATSFQKNIDGNSFCIIV